MPGPGTEVERLLVRIVGDNSNYRQTLRNAQKETSGFVRDAQGRLRNMKGHFVSTAQVLDQSLGSAFTRVNGRLRDAKGRFVSMKNTLASLEGSTAGYAKTVELSQARVNAALAASTVRMRLYRAATLALSTATKAAAASAFLMARSLAPLLVFFTAAATIKTAITQMASFELAMSRIEGLVGLSAEQIAILGRQIDDLAPKVGKTPTELAEGLYFVVSSGIDAADAMEVLEISAKASAAGLGDLSTVADAVTSAMNAYSGSGMTAERATDILIATIKEGKAEADELAQVIGKLFPTAAALGVSMEQLGGVMAVMSLTGADAFEAATSINAVFTTLLGTTKEGVDVLEAAGLSLKHLREVAAGPNGLVEVMRILDKTFQGDEEALRQVIPNVRAFRGLMNVLAQDADSVNKILNSVNTSAGSLDSAFEAASKTIDHQWNQAWAQLVTGLKNFAAVARPAIESLIELVREIGVVIDTVARAIAWLRGMSTENFELAGSTDKAADSINKINKEIVEGVGGWENAAKQVKEYKKGIEDLDEDVKEFAKEIEFNIRTFGMTEGQAEAVRLQDRAKELGRSINQTLIERGLLMDKELQKLKEIEDAKREADREQKRVLEEQQDALETNTKRIAEQAKNIIEANRTSIQQLKAELLEVADLELRNALTRQESTAAMRRMVRQFAESNQGSVGNRLPGGIRSGSAQAINLENRLRAGTGRTAEEGIWEMVNKAKLSNKNEEQIIAQMKILNAKTPRVAGFP